MKLFGYSNVCYDENSAHEFDQLNESLFIRMVFQQLQELMKDAFFEFDFFVYSNSKSLEFPESATFKSERKKVLLYFSDESGTNPAPYAKDYFAVFKAYIEPDLGLENVFPLPLGYVKEVPKLPMVPINDRAYSVFFRGNLNINRINFYRQFSKLKFILPSENFMRARMWNKTLYYRSLLVKMNSDFSNHFPNSIIKFNYGFKKGFSPKKYGEVLANSKIILCPKGFDRTECFRHFEGMRAGCIIISEKLPQTEFYHNSPIIQIENWREGLKTAKNLLEDPDAMENIHKKMIEWWEEKCSERGTANYINLKLKSLLIVSQDH